MGVAVLQVNYRGTAGFGREHLLAIQEGFETVPIDDIRAAVNWAVEERRFNPQRIVIMGEHFGGYLALRALEQYPDEFRAAVMVNAPTRIDNWTEPSTMFDPAHQASPGISRAVIRSDLLNKPNPPEFMSVVRADLVRSSLRLEKTTAPDDLDRPVLLIEDPDSQDTTPVPAVLGQWVYGLPWAQIKRVRIDGDLVDGSPETREQIFRELEAFLNEHFYDPNVQIGPLQVIPDETEPVRENLFE